MIFSASAHSGGLASPCPAARAASFSQASMPVPLSLRRTVATRHLGLRPAAPANVRGEFRPVSTTVAGIHISEMFPLLAQLGGGLHRSSVTHGDRIHTSAGYTMLTGVVHPQANAHPRR